MSYKWSVELRAWCNDSREPIGLEVVWAMDHRLCDVRGL